MTAAASSTHDPRDLLGFYAEAGVDEAVLDAPVDRFAESARPRAPATKPADLPTASTQADPRLAPQSQPGTGGPPAQQPRPHRASVPDGSQAAEARALAQGAATLEELRAVMAAFDGCNLKATAKSMVFADGNPQAELMLVGEAPGADEDIEGLPLVGRPGQLLDQILAAIGRDRSSVYIANVIPWRPPGNRTPTSHETEICRPFIERQIELAGPKLLVALGGPAAKLLTGSAESVLRVRGTWRDHITASGAVIPTMPTLRPDYLLRNPAHKKLAWRDFLEVAARLRGL